MHEDERALGVEPPTLEPRATGHIPQILAMIARLIERGCAYRAANGDVYYRVRHFANYGALSGKTLDELRAGARVEIGEEKEDPLDFVLWKSAKPGEPAWDSPWGPGRPGWHIECSAMSTAALGAHFDIHGGGMDLKFPHHENEIAQSECATGEPFVNVWMHVGFVRVNQEKMSKSLGNFFTVREVLKKYDPEVVRYFILTSHYRSPLDYTQTSLEQAKQALTHLYLALEGLPAAGGDEGEEAEGGVYRTAFEAAMDDDFNTPQALAVLFELAHELNRRRAAGETARAARLGRWLRSLAGVLGLLGRDPEAFLRAHPAAAPGGAAARPSPEEIETLIRQREEARRARNWAEADRIRALLREQGVILEDRPGGKTLWRRA
jgi:cysteinyl-tRNA synthetase